MTNRHTGVEFFIIIFEYRLPFILSGAGTIPYIIKLFLLAIKSTSITINNQTLISISVAVFGIISVLITMRNVHLDTKAKEKANIEFLNKRKEFYEKELKSICNRIDTINKTK